MRIVNRISVVALLVAGPLSAQTKQPSRQRTIAEALDSWITNTETHVIPAADALPADKYGFAPPTAYGDFSGVRTFAQQVKHLAANNYWMAALISRERPSAEESNETGPDSVQSKAQIMAYLAGSFAALHRAVKSIDADNVVAQVQNDGSWQTTRLSFAADAVAHSFDHYGQLVEYLRMNGIIPPDSRPAATRR